MKTPIGFLTVGSFVKKGGNLLQIFIINGSEVTAASSGGDFLTFDTPLLDLQDVQIA